MSLFSNTFQLTQLLHLVKLYGLHLGRKNEIYKTSHVQILFIYFYFLGLLFVCFVFYFCCCKDILFIARKPRYELTRNEKEAGLPDSDDTRQR